MKNGVPDHTILLAAGKGSRMGSSTRPKVCFEINGVPAINRAIEVYERCGIPRHTAVVGDRAGQVMETISARFDSVSYVFQKEQRGSAHALSCAIRALDLPDDADVLVAAGDRIVEEAVLKQLFQNYAASGCTLAFPVLRCAPDSPLGRVCTDENGVPAAVIEWDDIRQRRTIRMLRKMLTGDCVPDRRGLYEILCENFFGFNGIVQPEAARRAFGRLWDLLFGEEPFTEKDLLALLPEEKTGFSVGGATLSPSAAAAISLGNSSVYLARWSLLKDACKAIVNDNARQEEYLSDLVHYGYENRHGGSAPQLLVVESPRQLLGFNNPGELQEAEHLLAGSPTAELPEPDSTVFRPLSQWLRRMETPEFDHTLAVIYGETPEGNGERKAAIRQLLETLRQRFSPETLIGIFRSPGRLNLLGRHIDRQGGRCNLMTIGMEHLMAVSPRSDDRVTLYHIDAKRYPQTEFRMKKLLAEMPWEEWESGRTAPRGAGAAEWSSCIRDTLIRLQRQFPSQPLFGMDLVIGGDLPMAAGLSSQASLAVGAADAAVAVNQLQTFPAQYASLCTGSEYSAVKFCTPGEVLPIRFFPFAMEKTVPFPAEYRMMICDSGYQNQELWEGRSQYDHRLSCYEIGFRLIRKSFPQFCGVLEHLRDVNVKTLQMPLSVIYRILLSLPEHATYAELCEILGRNEMKGICQGHPHTRNTVYPVRGVVLFGLSECARAELCAQLLEEKRIDELGSLMKISHDGDRLNAPGGSDLAYHAPVSNGSLLERLDDLASGDPDRVIRSQLANQPGAYGGSTPDLDRMVDIVSAIPGVAGAQMAGAGLGGSMMVLVRAEAQEAVSKALEEQYYRPRKIAPKISVCRPAAGAGPLPVLD